MAGSQAWKNDSVGAWSTVCSSPAWPIGVGATGGTGTGTGAGAGPAIGGSASASGFNFTSAPQCGHQGGRRPSPAPKRVLEQLGQVSATAMIVTPRLDDEV